MKITFKEVPFNGKFISERFIWICTKNSEDTAITEYGNTLFDRNDEVTFYNTIDGLPLKPIKDSAIIKPTGKLIVMEGVDGAGKSTHVKWLASVLETNLKTVITTREPGGTPLAEKIREILLNEYMSIESEALLMFASRKEHVETLIKPALEKGYYVISDRFVESSYGLQGGGRQLGIEKIKILDDFVLDGFKADLTFLFDLPVDKAQERLMLSGKKQNRLDLESLEFHQRTRTMFLKRAKDSGGLTHILDASKSIEDLRVEMVEILHTSLLEKI